MARLQLILLLALVTVTTRAGAADCQGVMAALAAAQRDAQGQMEVIDALESAIGAPSWDPVSDGWMIGAHADAIDDLVGYLNTASLAEEQAHAAHCYLNTGAP